MVSGNLKEIYELSDICIGICHELVKVFDLVLFPIYLYRELCFQTMTGIIGGRFTRAAKFLL